MRNVTILLSIMAVLALAGTAWGADYTWDDGATDSEWSTTEAGPTTNWAPESLPDYDTSDNATIAKTGGNYAATITVAGAETYNLYMGTDATATGSLAITGTGEDLILKTRYTYIRSGSSITLNAGKHEMSRSFNIDAGGRYDLDGGLVTIGWGSALGGTLDQTGGMFRPNMWNDHNMTLSGTYEIHGGTMKIGTDGNNKCELRIADGGSLKIYGTSPDELTIYRRDSDDQVGYRQESGGTLWIEIDAGGVDTINVIGKSGAGGVALFESGCIVDMEIANGVSLEDGDYFDLLTAVSLTDFDGVVSVLPTLAGTDSDNWTLSFEGGTTLRATYVPEPATLSLLGLGGIGVLLRRKHR
ncbi:MAG: PEP-CTERM sorting domain-containing protein [Phycisphaerae bacterium]|nr:PEP-CTERM sorting domain-containing protein [Phycisphaerae bacterium]